MALHQVVSLTRFVIKKRAVDNNNDNNVLHLRRLCRNLPAAEVLIISLSIVSRHSDDVPTPSPAAATDNVFRL